MVEQIFQLSRSNDKAVEKVIFDENVHYLHMGQYAGREENER